MSLKRDMKNAIITLSDLVCEIPWVMTKDIWGIFVTTKNVKFAYYDI